MKKNSFIPVAQPDLSGNERKYLNLCFTSSWISSKGEFIDRFEEFFAKFVGTKYAVATSNGTTALHVALVALGVSKGDEVIVPDLTFIASANTVTYTGATPILVDVGRKTWNIAPEEIEKKISAKTRAIMPVHLYGHPADMKKIMTIAKRYHLLVIEDAAEAHGAEINIKYSCEAGSRFAGQWKKVGGIGDVGCFSFYGNKIITTGEGGMVVTNNKNLADKMRILRDHGQVPEKRYYHKVVGFNYRMTNLQAAIGVAQLERIEEFIEKKRWIAQMYDSSFADIPGITSSPREQGKKSVYWMYSILVDKPYPKTRDQLMEILKKENIETRPFFYPLHKLPPYKVDGDFRNSAYLSTHGVNLPSSVTLTEKEIERIVYIIRKQVS